MKVLGWLWEGFQLIVGVLVIGFTFSLEEPLFDMSDWNFTHVVLLTFSLLSVFTELRIRSYYGQLGIKDGQVSQGVLAFWLALERYAALILVVSGLHFLMPIEVDLYDLVDVFSVYNNLFSLSIVGAFNLGLGFTMIILVLTLGGTWGKRDLILMLLGGSIIVLVVAFSHLGYDYHGGVIPSQGELLDYFSLYQSARAGTLFEYWGGNADVFDWHKASNKAHTVRFEELYALSVAGLGLLSLTIALVWWGYVGWDYLRRGPDALNATSLGVGRRLNEHAIFNLLLGVWALTMAALRILTRVPIEMWFWGLMYSGYWLMLGFWGFGVTSLALIIASLWHVVGAGVHIRFDVTFVWGGLWVSALEERLLSGQTLYEEFFLFWSLVNRIALFLSLFAVC
jgi:hypothetical protein